MKAGLAVLFCLAIAVWSGATGLAAEVAVYRFSLDSDPGWTATGGWQYGSGPDCCAVSAHTGEGWYSHVKDASGPRGYGTYSDGMAEESLTTLALDCTGLTDVKLKFWRMLGLPNSSVGPGDRAAVQVSNDGTTWTTVWESQTDPCDDIWSQYEYDISAVADNQATVYIRWVMGPSNSDGCVCYGWEVDDVEIWATTPAAALQILVWTRYADLAREYPNTLAALATHYPGFAVTESDTSYASVLEEELVGKHVFLVPEPEKGSNAELEAAGLAFADALQTFVENGGTVIVCGERGEWQGFMVAAGLMEAEYAAEYWMGESLPVVYPAHPLARGLGATVNAQNATMAYTIGPEATSVIEDDLGNAVLAYRDIGLGAAIMIGYDYYEWDDSAARVIANAVAYPHSARSILLYDHNTVQGSAREALARLSLPYTRANADNFNTLLAAQDWETVIVDCPNYEPGGTFPGDWAPLIGYIEGGGKAAVSYWQYLHAPDLAAALGVESTGWLEAIPPIYRWGTEHPLFNAAGGVPNLLTWADRWTHDAERLALTDPEAEALAGFTETPADNEAALVLGNGGRTIANGFLWDDHAQDSDADGVEDCVELVMNEVAWLVFRPEADFTATPTSGAPPLTVAFTDTSQGYITSWSWDFGDGGTSNAQNPSHAYTSPGRYTVTLTVSNLFSRGAETKTDHITVSGMCLPPEADFSASPTGGDSPLTVHFTDLSTGNPSSWWWEFGDGGTSSERNPIHEYTRAGTYTVSLTATNACGRDTETKAGYIAVWAGPQADFTSDVRSGDAPLLVQFADLSTGGPTSWLWGFGDGGTSGARNPTHEYGSAGRYTVSLTVSNEFDSDVETKSDYITVWGPRQADFQGSPREGTAPLAVSFTDLSTNGPTSWLWDLGDGSTSHEQNPTHEYTEPGFYTVTLTATGPPGTYTETKTHYIVVGFADAGPGHWASGSVIACYEAEVVGGFPDGSYRPDLVVSRDQMAVYISRALCGGDASVPSGPAQPRFPDVGAEHWAYKYIMYAVSQNVVQGYPDGDYRPELAVDRGQMAVFIARALVAPRGDAGLPSPPKEATFRDVTGEQLSKWYWCYRHVEYIAARGVTQGYPDGCYHPERQCTRDQMAVYIQRAFELPM